MVASITTPVTTLLGFKHPIMLAGMSGVSNGTLAAAVANAGGFSVIGGYKCTPEQLRQIIAEMKGQFSDPSLPFGIDIALPKIGGSARKTNQDCTNGRLDELIDITIQSGAKLFVSSSGVPPKHIIERLHHAGIFIMNLVGHPKHAVKALDAGVDMVCAQGGEGRGQVGNITTSILLPAVVEVAQKYKPPMLQGSTALVVAGGGISCGKSLASALVQGAGAVWICTRFMASAESNASEAAKQAILDCDYDSTEKTVVLSGRPLRMKTNDYIREWHGRPADIDKLCSQGVVPMDYDIENGRPVDVPVFMGQIAGSITQILPVQTIVNNMVDEAAARLRVGGNFLRQERSKL